LSRELPWRAANAEIFFRQRDFSFFVCLGLRSALRSARPNAQHRSTMNYEPNAACWNSTSIHLERCRLAVPGDHSIVEQHEDLRPTSGVGPLGASGSNAVTDEKAISRAAGIEDHKPVEFRGGPLVGNKAIRRAGLNANP